MKGGIKVILALLLALLFFRLGYDKGYEASVKNVQYLIGCWKVELAKSQIIFDD